MMNLWNASHMSSNVKFKISLILFYWVSISFTISLSASAQLPVFISLKLQESEGEGKGVGFRCGWIMHCLLYGFILMYVDIYKRFISFIMFFFVLTHKININQIMFLCVFLNWKWTVMDSK